ncbi:MAG: hypothetical protein A2V66_16275 [Ignavibacteria bacterium RBG_13_36_8]|nr:MAG: hypothetical protein A2V66_16275 [Ignavibacteria bacterium RBG_13_36_8]
MNLRELYLKKLRDNLMKTLSIILSIICIVLGIILYNTVVDKNGALAISRQNQLALNDSLKIFKEENKTLYHKYAEVQKIDEIKDRSIAKQVDILSKKDEKILTLTKQNIKLRDIINQGVQEEPNTSEIPLNLVGHELTFKDSTDFYKYRIKVTLGNPSIHTFKQSFYNDILQTIHLTRNKEGEYSGYSEFEPEFVNNYLSINNIRFILDQDEFVRIEGDINKFRLTIFPSFGIFTFQPLYLHAGLKVLINRKHLVGYSHGIGNDLNLLEYGYGFDIIK